MAAYRTVRAQYLRENDVGLASYSYSVWCTGERELYDLIEDPEQLHNLLAPLNSLGAFAPFNSKLDGHMILNKTAIRLLHRLDALMLVLKTCIGKACADPYSELLSHRSQRLGTSGFADLLDPDLDEYFARLPKVSFKACDLGYHRALEQPEWEDALGQGMSQEAREKAQIVFQHHHAGRVE